MTLDEAVMYLLHNHEGPFPPEVWRHIEFMYESSGKAEKCSIEKIDLAYCQQTEKETKTSTGSEN